MAGISQNAKTGDLPAFGECVGIASKALCGLTEAIKFMSRTQHRALCQDAILDGQREKFPKVA